jgi:hypothetical protein
MMWITHAAQLRNGMFRAESMSIAALGAPANAAWRGKALVLLDKAAWTPGNPRVLRRFSRCAEPNPSCPV